MRARDLFDYAATLTGETREYATDYIRRTLINGEPVSMSDYNVERAYLMLVRAALDHMMDQVAGINA